jgi:acyl-CoA thioester hydrolase
MNERAKERAMPLVAGSAVVADAEPMPTSHSPAARERRAAYGFLTSVPLRWSDFDMMGHVNNVQFMRFFECAVVDFFRRHDVFPPASTVTAFAAENMCRFLKPLNYPLAAVDCGMRVERLSRSCVRFGFALFRKEEEAPSCVGYWVHVFIDRTSMRPVPMPDQSRAVFEKYLNPGAWTAPGGA